MLQTTSTARPAAGVDRPRSGGQVVARFEAERQALAMMIIRTSPKSWMPAPRTVVGPISSWNWSRVCRSPGAAM